MNRRQFLLTGGTIVTASTAGCLFGSDDNAPPPRKSNLVETFSVAQGSIAAELVSPEEMWLMSRRDAGSGDDETTRRVMSGLGTLSPLGVVSAKGRGASGRGRAADGSRPQTGNGFIWFGGGGYTNSWYDNHEDEVTRYDVDIADIGIAYLGDNQTFRESAPGPGPVSWDDTYDTPDGSREMSLPLAEGDNGWRRVGANVVAAGGTADFGWESYDLRIQDTGGGPEITEQWKVSPRI